MKFWALSRIVLIFTPCLFAACTSIRVVETPTETDRIGTIPALSVSQTASVGSTLFTQFKYRAKTGYRIPAGYLGSVGGAKVVVSPNDFLFKAEVDGKAAFCTENPTVLNLLSIPHLPSCFTDSKMTGSFSEAMVSAGSLWWKNEIAPPIRYERQEKTFPSSDAFKRELIYQGSGGKILRLAYREYIGDLVRPAYSQEVTYDVSSAPMTVTFKSVQIQVTDISASTITYKVLSGF